MDARHGLLIVVPVPEADASSPGEVDGAIARALADAEAEGIRGKSLTPFLLARIAELSGGASLRTNQALLVHNARTAGLIARELVTMLAETTRGRISPG